MEIMSIILDSPRMETGFAPNVCLVKTSMPLTLKRKVWKYITLQKHSYFLIFTNTEIIISEDSFSCNFSNIFLSQTSLSFQRRPQVVTHESFHCPPLTEEEQKFYPIVSSKISLIKQKSSMH